MVGSEAKLLVGKDAYIVNDFDKPFSNDPFRDLPRRRKKTDGAMILGEKLIFPGFRDEDDVDLFPPTWKETKFEQCVPKIEQCSPDFALEAVRCSLVGSFSGSSCMSSRSVPFPD